MSESDKGSHDVMQAIQSLTKMVASQPKRCKRQRFPFSCRNGPSCQWMACGACWFSHDCSDKVKKDGEVKGQKLEDIADRITMKLKQLEDKIERRISSLSHHVDRLFGEMAAKLDSLAEATFKNETDIEDVLADRQALAATDKLRSELAADLDNQIDMKLVEFLATDVRTSFENAMQAFAVHVDDRVQIIKGKSGLVDDGDGGLKVKDNG